MRADRLIAELMLLQTRKKVSAAQMAQEMEVSQRTIYRDMLALNTAGIPIYAENGSNGGYQLVDGYRTQLTGFSKAELQALFAMNIPAILGELGMDAEGKTALRKLQASLSQRQNEEGNFMAQRFLYDPTPWAKTSSQSPQRSLLEGLQQAIWANQMVEIDVAHWYRPEKIVMQIAPYALILKTNHWYLAYYRQGSYRILNLTEIVKVQSLDRTFLRESGFNLQTFWTEWANIQQAQTQHFEVTILLRQKAKSAFMSLQQKNIKSISKQPDSWHTVVCAFHNLEEARSSLLQWGGAIQILEPEPLRLNMIDYAQQFLKTNT